MDALTIVVMLAMLATVFVLFTGIGSMVRGGDYDYRHSHELMFTRVGLQALTVLLLVLALGLHTLK